MGPHFPFQESEVNFTIGCWGPYLSNICEVFQGFIFHELSLYQRKSLENFHLYGNCDLTVAALTLPIIGYVSQKSAKGATIIEKYMYCHTPWTDSDSFANIPCTRSTHISRFLQGF